MPAKFEFPSAGQFLWPFVLTVRSRALDSTSGKRQGTDTIYELGAGLLERKEYDDKTGDHGYPPVRPLRDAFGRG